MPRNLIPQAAYSPRVHAIVYTYVILAGGLFGRSPAGNPNKKEMKKERKRTHNNRQKLLFSRPVDRL